MSFSENKWNKLVEILRVNFNKNPDLNAILFLIGVQELGKGFEDFSKEQKQDLMHIATCKILSFSGYYSLLGQDEDGWPVWQNTKTVPSLSLKEQDQFLKLHVLEYFSDIYELD